jgi:hypothetical protein
MKTLSDTAWILAEKGSATGLRQAARVMLASAVASCALLGYQGADPAAAALELKRIGNFATPVHVDAAPGYPRLLFVVEKAGRIVVLRDGERGLLSVAFPPNYKKSRRFYVYYTENDGDNRVEEFRRARGRPARAVASSRRRVLLIPHPSTTNHNGGQLQFGFDRNLYISTGDGGSNPNVAADLDVLLGKLLRVDPRKRDGRRYTVPPDNPYVGRLGRDEIYSYGLRNPWRFSFDSVNGRLSIGDVGSGSREEVNYLTRQEANGVNFGWPQWEGDQPHSGDAGPDPPTFPIFTYPHPDGCSVIGGYVVRDPGLPELAGRYLYTDLCHGDLRSFVPSLSGASDDQSTGLSVNSPTSFGEGRGDRIYVTSYGGGVFRLRSSP